MKKTVAYLAMNWAIILVCVGLTFRYPTVFFLTFFVIANRQFANYLVGHDGLHGAISRNVRVNRLIAKYLCLYPVAVSFYAYQTNHIAHHRFLGSTVDPDLKLYSFYPLSFTKFLKQLFLSFANGSLLMDFLRYFTPANQFLRSTTRESWKTGDYFEYTLAVLSLITLLFVAGGAWLLCIWFLPLLLMIPYYYFVSALQHGLVYGLEAPANSRNISGNPLLMEMFLPCSTHLHGVHHDHPSVPFHELEKYRVKDRTPTQSIWSVTKQLFVRSV